MGRPSNSSCGSRAHGGEYGDRGSQLEAVATEKRPRPQEDSRRSNGPEFRCEPASKNRDASGENGLANENSVLATNDTICHAIVELLIHPLSSLVATSTRLPARPVRSAVGIGLCQLFLRFLYLGLRVYPPTVYWTPTQ